MNLNFVDLARKRNLAEKIKKHKELMQMKNAYTLFDSNQAKRIFRPDIDYKNWKDFYDTFKRWDDTGFLDAETGKNLERLINDRTKRVAIHRTGGHGIIDISELDENEDLVSTLTDGLKLTASTLQGAVEKDFISLARNVTELTQEQNMVACLKGSYVDSNVGIIFVFPAECITQNFNVQQNQKDQILYEKKGNIYIRPECIKGFVTQDQGKCTYYDREEFLSNKPTLQASEKH